VTGRVRRLIKTVRWGLWVLVERRPGRNPDWYILFAVVAGGLGLWAMGDAESFAVAWPYLTLGVVFLAQLLYPTFLGWGIGTAGWFCVCFVWPLYDRIANHVVAYSLVFLSLWGAMPILALWLLRPRARAGSLRTKG